jgi:hypothetical protein
MTTTKMHYNKMAAKLKAMGFTYDSYYSRFYKLYKADGAAIIRVTVRPYNFAYRGHDYGIADMNIGSETHFNKLAGAAHYDRPEKALELAHDIEKLNSDFLNWTTYFNRDKEKTNV